MTIFVDTNEQRRTVSSTKAFADDLLVTKGNVIGLVSRLEAHNLLLRRPHASDGRSFNVHSRTKVARCTVAPARRPDDSSAPRWSRSIPTNSKLRARI